MIRLIDLKYKVQSWFVKCKICYDGEFYPQYGKAPHQENWNKNLVLYRSNNQLENFETDDEDNTCGIYYCPNEKCENHISRKGKYLIFKED